MSAILRVNPRVRLTADEIDQQARELAAYNNALSAQQRGDHEAAREHMRALSEIHGQRPAGMVERLEIAKRLR